MKYKYVLTKDQYNRIQSLFQEDKCFAVIADIISKEF
jgi:hypothetical protein